MKKSSLSIFAALLFVLILTMPGFAWQGRMAGFGDANGLIEDESDYLTHPSIIASSGKALNVYGNYRLTYDKTTKWDYRASAPIAGVSYPYAANGQEWKNEGQLGAAFALGAGRMGVFFEYTGISGKYSGEENYIGFWGPNAHAFDLKNNLDNYALRIIYGLPVASTRLGGELQIAYHNEQKETFFSDLLYKNYPWAAEDAPALNLYPYMIPSKSKYWEAQGKVSVDGSMGPAKYALTLKGSLPFASSNEYLYENGPTPYVNAEGKVKGFNVGGDFWLRVPVNNSVVMPFVVSTGYKTIQRDGSGLSNSSTIVTYEHKTKDVFVKVGGGVDITPTKGTKLAAGLYYDYLQTNQNMLITDVASSSDFYLNNYTDMPKFSEHRITIKALAEKELSPAFVLRGGFNVFYGLVKSDYTYLACTELYPYSPVHLPTRGSNWGVNASIGATMKFDRASLEPFVSAGYASYKTNGNGDYGNSPAEAEFNKTNWLVGGGLSVKF